MAETYYLRNSTSVLCKAFALSATAGIGSTTETIDGTNDDWDNQPGEKTYQNANWTVVCYISTGTGGGPPNEVTCTLERLNSGCTLQQTIGSDAQATTKGGSDEAITFTISPGATAAFGATDVLAVTFTDTNGNQTKTITYDGSQGGGQDSRITTPDEVVAGGHKLLPLLGVG